MRLLILLFFPLFVLGQSSSKARKAYNKAIELYQNDDPSKAKKLALSAIKNDADFLDPYLLLGDIEEQAGNIEQAINYYLSGLSDNNPKNLWGYVKVGKMFFYEGNYTKSKIQFEHYLSFDNQNKELFNSAKKYLDNCNFAIEALKNPVHFVPKNMGSAINSNWEEYLPSISADGKIIIITRRGPHKDQIISEDFYYSKFINNKWSPAQNMGASINTIGNEGAQCLSADGKTLFFTACDRVDGLGRCDIYISFNKDGFWSEARNIGPTINSKYWDSQPSFSPDGRDLYFVSNRPGGFGGMDIWKSTLSKSGYFSEPVNLGPTINTPFNEMSPFIHTDNRTFYFASDGHVGMGNFDLFISKREGLNSSWSDPVNLGSPINTFGVENSLVVASDGKTAYYASSKSGYGKEDIFYFLLAENIQAQEVAYLQANVIDADKKTALKADIEIIDLETGQVVVSSFSNKDGMFYGCLPANSNYAINVSKKGFLFYSEYFKLTNESSTKALSLNALLQKVESGKSVVLKNIFFDVDDYSFKKESLIELEKLKYFLTSNPGVSVMIEGHTDNTGNENYNRSLSENRAKAVYLYLIKHGIKPERLQYVGYGSQQAIDTNETERGRSNNRRTVFKIN